MTALLTVDGLTIVRGGRALLKGESFALSPGDAALVTGANGTGKSSLLRVVAGLLRPAAGTVATRAPVALLAEAGALDPDRPLAAALLFWARLDGRVDAAARVADALRDGALDDLADVPVRMLSTGQRRRAAFARVQASPAALWLLDEPANGLDAAAVARLEAAIAAHRRRGGAVVVATHQPFALPEALAVRL